MGLKWSRTGSQAPGVEIAVPQLLGAMVKVIIGKPEDPWCEIELTDEDVEDWKKGVDITEEKLEEEVNGKYWHALIMALHRVREDFVKKQRKMKHLDWYLTMKRTSDKRNPKYYV